MSITKVRKYFDQFNRSDDIIELDDSSATVELAAKALDVIPARIAKTLSFKDGDNCFLIVTAGDAKVDNKKFKTHFGFKAKMPSPDEVLEHIGHSVGGVCPFGVKYPNTKVYCDISLKRFDTIFPACGSSNSAIELNCDELFKYSNSIEYIDVCKEWE